MSSLETEVIDSLEDLRYPEWESLKSNSGSISDLCTFSSIVGWLSNQLIQLNAGLDSIVNPISSDMDLKSFEIELNSLLRELCSPFAGYGSQLTHQNKLAIINYLCGELLASRMNAVNHNRIADNATNGATSITANESETGKDLKSVLISLGMGKPPPNISSQILFKKLMDKLKERLGKTNFAVEDSLLLPNGLTLSPNQWKTLLQINSQFYNDYKLRRQMLLTRCDCTVTSFKWKSSKCDDKSKSDANNDFAKQLDNAYSTERNNLSDEPNVAICDALAARESDCDLLLNSRISVSHVPCIVTLPQTTGMANKSAKQQLVQQDLHKFLIGSVPDRGGRPDDQPPPPKESFTQQQQQRDNPQRGRGGRGNYSSGGRGAGNVNTNQPQRVQGAGWTQNSGGTDRYSSNQSQDSGYSSKGGFREPQYDNYQTGQNSYHSGQQQQRHNDNYHQTGHQRYGDGYQGGQQRLNDNYSSGQQRYGSAQHSYQQDGHYRGGQQQYQMDYQQSSDRRNYSDNYGNANTNNGDNYQQPYYQDTTYYNQSDRNYNRGNRRGGRR